MNFDYAINEGGFIHTNKFLSNFATSYKLSQPCADFVSPPILVKRPSDKYAIYTKSINRVFNNKVEGYQKALEVNWDVDQGLYSCDEYQLAKGVSYRAKRNTDDIFSLDYDAVRFLKRFQALARENRVASIATSASYVTQTSNVASAWSNISLGTPFDDILTGMATVALATGGYVPNKIVIPIDIALTMIQTTNWKDHFKYTTTGFANGLFSVVDGLRNIGLEPMLTMIMGSNQASIFGSTPGMSSIWGNNTLLFYSEANPTLETRTFMYSPYTLKDLITTEPRIGERRDLHAIYEEIDETLIDTSCAYLFTNCK